MKLWMKGGIGVVAILVIGFVGFRIFQDAIMWRLFERAVEQNIAVDLTDELPDGLHVFLCGTGSPMPDDRRAAVCTGVIAGDKAFIFDAGSGGIRKLGRMQFPMGKLEGTYLTHLHSDHIDGLGELMLMAWVGTNEFRSEPLPISGPTGTARVVNAFNEAYQLDRGYRVAHHGADIATPSGHGGQPFEIVLPAGPNAGRVVYEEDDIRITAVRVSHAPIEPAFGYRIDYKDRSVSLSGDTIYHPGFVAVSEGVDIMFHEAEDPEMVEAMAVALDAAGRPNTAILLRDTLDYHATPEDAARAAAEAGATELIYYHIVPPLPTPALNGVWLGDADQHFDGKISLGEDGTLISLPAGSERIIKSQAF